MRGFLFACRVSYTLPMSYPHRMRNTVFFGNLLFSLATAITLYTNSSFIETAFGERAVSALYAAGAVVTILLLARASSLLRAIGNRTFFLLFGAIYAVSTIFLVLPAAPDVRLVSLLAYLAAGNILVYSFNIFFERLTQAHGRGRARGIFLLLQNIGYFVGPLAGALGIAYAGYGGSYILGLALFAATATVLSLGLRRYEDAEYETPRERAPLREALARPTLIPVITANFVLQFFYAWMIIYTPIYLSQYLGMSWVTIGIVFTVMLAPFVLLDYPLGRIADRIGSEKELTAIGFVIMIGSVLGIALLPDLGTVSIAALLFASRIGAATVEAMTEIHFYKTASAKESRLLSVFSDLRPLSYVLGPLLGLAVLATLPFRDIFTVLAGILCIGFVASLWMERPHAWWARAHQA